MARPTRLAQTLLGGPLRELNKPIPTIIIPESTLNDSDIITIFDHARPLGLSPGYSPQGKLIALAIADDSACRIIEFQLPPKRRDGNTKPPTPNERNQEARQLIQDQILCRDAGEVIAFDMGPLTMSLYCDLGLRIINALDIQSAFPKLDRMPLSIIKAVIGDALKINTENIKNIFLNPVFDEANRNRHTDLAMRAWISQFLVTYENGAETFEKVPRIDTKKLDAQHLDVISKVQNDALRLDQKKPLQTVHRVTQSLDAVNNEVRLSSQDFNKRLRSEMNVKMKMSGEHGSFSVKGTMVGVSGKSGNVNTNHAVADKSVLAVISTGRDGPTSAEARRDATVLSVLQGSKPLTDSGPWIQNIWFPQDGILSWPPEWSQVKKPFRPKRTGEQGNLVRHPLNGSQQEGVNCMLSPLDDHRIVIIQGPPGTGKTSVIASFVQLAIQAGEQGIWLVAQSNVAVKNIAEKLIKVGFNDWRLLVSKDFHFEWHEHIYHQVENHVIRSDTFNFASNKANLRGIQVMLCTLSMLSNNQIVKFTKEIPLRVLVVDEASQIEIGNYMSIFTNFNSTLRKACFIGDDKQLPPFGQEDLEDLQSIFEVPHLRKHVVFLNTQYRMPPQIGDIISAAVYDGKLKSNPQHLIKDDTIATYFIDIPGRERPQQNGSFKNLEECEVILQLAQKLQDAGRNYKIITPYEGQRGLIEEKMKNTEGLEWGDKCFNVDSFQGNEEDYIIISVVRSRGIGFLNNLRRTNVMLTRCKKGMFIATSRQFLSGAGEDSLVGQYMNQLGPEAWLAIGDIEAGKFLED